jgi:hypothetical protein
MEHDLWTGRPVAFVKKLPKIVAKSAFCDNQYITVTSEKSCPIFGVTLCIVATYVIFIKTTQSKQSPNRRKFAQSGGVNGRIFSTFDQF